MSGVEELILQQVRSHTSATFQFAPGANAIVGPNGSGKTTIIEALFTLMRGRSFRGAMSEMTTYGTQHLQMKAKLSQGTTTHERSVGYENNETTSQKKWTIDGKKYGRLPLSGQLPTVLFEPDLGRLITGGPERRRTYLDQIAGQLDIEVARAQKRLERVLRQRNYLLKQLQASGATTTPEELFIWNTQIAHLSEQVVGARCDLISQLQQRIDQYYHDLGGSDTILLTYSSSVTEDPGNYASRLLNFLETGVQRDIALGHTHFGPHRDDLAVQLADQPATQRASRGEIRTIVVALKLIETELLADSAKRQQFKPVLLLDDVLSELDLVHQERVLAGFKDYQVFITTTDAHALDPGVHTIALS